MEEFAFVYRLVSEVCVGCCSGWSLDIYREHYSYFMSRVQQLPCPCHTIIENYTDQDSKKIQESRYILYSNDYFLLITISSVISTCLIFWPLYVSHFKFLYISRIVKHVVVLTHSVTHHNASHLKSSTWNCSRCFRPASRFCVYDPQAYDEFCLNGTLNIVYKLHLKIQLHFHDIDHILLFKSETE